MINDAICRIFILLQKEAYATVLAFHSGICSGVFL